MKSVDGDVRLSADINIEPAEKKIRKLASDATSILNVKGKGTKGVEDGFTRAINKANEFKQVASSINVDTKMQALENKVKDAGDALSLAKTKLEDLYICRLDAGDRFGDGERDLHGDLHGSHAGVHGDLRG